MSLSYIGSSSYCFIFSGRCDFSWGSVSRTCQALKLTADSLTLKESSRCLGELAVPLEGGDDLNICR